MNSILQRPYLITAFIGFFVCAIVAYINLSAMKIPHWRAVRLTCIGMACFLVGACVSAMSNWFLFDMTGTSFMDRLYTAGFTWYPGILAFLLVFAVASKLLREDVKESINAVTPCLLIFLAIARIGCVLVGCCYGVEAHFEFFGHAFTRVPTALIESLFSFVLFFIMQFITKRHRLPIFMYGYGVFRFILEFYRGDNRGELIPGISLTTSQQIALGCIIVTTIVLLISFLKKKKSSILESESETPEDILEISDKNR